MELTFSKMTVDTSLAKVMSSFFIFKSLCNNILLYLRIVDGLVVRALCVHGVAIRFEIAIQST